MDDIFEFEILKKRISEVFYQRSTLPIHGMAINAIKNKRKIRISIFN